MTDSPRVNVKVQSIYLESQSTPDEARFIFAYTVTIRNLGQANVQLMGRYWLITNSNGRQIEVHGEGVLGEQPVIFSGNEFQYTSGAILETPIGTMEGYYKMIDSRGQPFHTDIPVFRLSIPSLIH